MDPAQIAVFGPGPNRGRIAARAEGSRAETIDEVYQKAKKEEGVLNCYCSLAQINAERIYPVFEKRFPGIKINHVDATSDKLAVRAITEARGGRVFSDVFEFGLENINQLYEQKLLLDNPSRYFKLDLSKEITPTPAAA